MLRLLATIFAALQIACIVAVAPAEAGRRLALVIGNDDYANVTRLQKAVNDARSVAATLRSLGFEVTDAANLTRRAMNAVLSEFAGKIGEGDTAMLFYAGHGVAIDNKNYLLPIDVPDATSADEDFIRAESLALDDIIERMKSRRPRLNLLVLDACRNNPFTGAATRSLGTQAGLARITAPQGTFVIYSADDGQAALDRLGDDDDNPNSVFTRELIPLMRQPDLDLVDMAREVRRRVNRLAGTVRHDQTPSYYDAMLGDFFFSADTARKPAGDESETAPEDEPQRQASLPPDDAQPPGQPEPKPLLTPLAGRALIVTASEKDTVRLWDPVDAQLIAELEGEKISLSAARILQDGQALAIATRDGALFSYAIPAFRKQNALFPGFRVTDLAEAPGGILLAGGNDGSLAAIDIASFDILWKTGHQKDVVGPIVVSKDGRSAVSASGDGTIVEFSLADGSLLHTVATVRGKSITDIAHVSSSVVIAVHEDGTIAHINIDNGRILSAFSGGRGWISSVEVLGGGEYVTAGVDGTLSFWTLGSQRPTRKLKAHGDVASAAKLMRFGGALHMISTGFDGMVNIWDGEGRRLQSQLRHGRAILYLDLASAGQG